MSGKLTSWAIHERTHKLVGRERRRQAIVEDYSPSHDDEHTKGELAYAAAAYLLPGHPGPALWPWPAGFKPTNRISDLVKAAALIEAEIERLMRLENRDATVLPDDSSGE